MNEKELYPLTCPFCGAPQRRYVPSDTCQVRCHYCGGVFLVQPFMGGDVYRCFSHADKMAVGLCNDCGKSFCGECLHSYDLKSEDVKATLYLCPECLRKRYIDAANGFVYGGLSLSAFGIFVALFSLPIGILCVIFGVGVILYGFSRRTEAFGEATIEELRTEQQKREAENAAAGVDAEGIYNELLTQYIQHWGAQTGIEFLENEIRAHTRNGESFQVAVQKIYQRQQKKKKEKESS